MNRHLFLLYSPEKITDKISGYSSLFKPNYPRNTQLSTDDLMKRRNRPSNKSNKINVPEARAAMDKFKMEAAADNGRLTSREAGSAGNQMVKKICSVRPVTFYRTTRTAMRRKCLIITRS